VVPRERVVVAVGVARPNRMEIDDDSHEETRSLFGRPAGPRVFHLEVRYLAMVTGVLLGLFCGRHLVSSHATARVASAAPPLLPRVWTHVKEVGSDAAQPPEAQPPPEAQLPPEARPPPEGAEPVKESWEEVRSRILKAQIQMEADAKKTKAMPRYAGPRVLKYLYVGPGHVVKDLKGSQQPGNVTERECSTYCTANPKCKGFAWFRTTKWSGVSECYLKDSCPSDALRAMPGAFSWENPRMCDTSAQFQAQNRENGREDAQHAPCTVRPCAGTAS